MVNEILSKELQVKPLVRGDMAIYKVLGAGEPMSHMHYDDGSPVLSSPRFSMKGESTISDPFDGNKPNKTITNAARTRPIKMPDGSTHQEEVIERVKFDNAGFKFVKFDDMQTYFFLERCNENKDNPYRNRSRKAMFERVRANKKAVKDLDSKLLDYEALAMVMEGTIDELKLMATHLPDGMKVSLDNPLDVIKMDLIRVAEKNPRALIEASGNKDAKRLIQFRDAAKYNVLVWDDKLREWYLNKPSGLEKLCEVQIGVDRFQELLKFTKQKETAKYYSLIVMLLGKVYKATVT